MFDPMANFNMHYNWMMLIIIISFIPLPFWVVNSRMTIILELLTSKLHQELSSLFNKNIMYKGTTLLMISCFMYILMSNLTSNFPYSFCVSAHMSFSMSLALPIWLSIIMFQWTNLFKTCSAHLVPLGTPIILMPLMVMIELTSNVIRPMALAVRLTANLIAGHLLMALLGNTFNFKQMNWMIILNIQTMFLLFELMVAMIQAYVFSVLMTLYSSEIN
uniref:ATP synthase subunit a n=1 Tax=Colposcenia ignota TaxID=3230277 RepID=A0AAU8G9A7_9HEMI